MDTLLIGITLVVVVVLLLAVIVVLVLQFRKPAGTLGDFSTALQNLTQTVQQGQIQIATLTEKVALVEQHQTTANQGLGSLAMGLAQTGATLAAKVSDAQLLSNNSLVQVGAGLTSELTKAQRESSTTLAELKTLTTGLSEATAAIRSELARAKSDLTELQTNSKARQDLELQTANSIKRLEAVIAGTQSKGSAGENILEAVFAKLPIEWQVRNFKVGGKPVEFGLKLPNNLILPIDSKWAATNLLEQFIATTDIDERQRLKVEIEAAVIQKAKEVKKYIDPSLTVPFGIAVIPDAIHDLCTGIHAEAFQLNVVLVSYSMFIPYLLLVFQTTLKQGQSLDLQKLEAYLQTAQGAVKALQDELDGRYSRAMTMLTNSRDDMRAQLSKVGGSLTGLQVGTAPLAPALPESAAAAPPL